MREKNIILVSPQVELITTEICLYYEEFYQKLYKLLKEDNYTIIEWTIDLKLEDDWDYLMWIPKHTPDQVLIPVVILPFGSMTIDYREDIVEDVLNYAPAHLFVINELELDLSPFFSINQQITQIPHSSLEELLLALEQI